MYYSDDDITRINTDVDIVKLITSRGVKLDKKGSNFVGCCPFHNERTGSFVAFPGRNNFKCFGCGEGGNPISFVMKHDNLTFPEAVKILSQEFNIPVKAEEDRLPSPEELKAKEIRESIYRANTRASQFYVECLAAKNDKAKFAREYINKRWGAKFAQSMSIGFAPGGSAFLDFALSKGDNVDVLKTANLVKDVKGSLLDTFYDRVVIPIFDRNHNIIGFTARVLDDSQPKYINTAETPVFKKSEIVFGINTAQKQARKDELIYLVEGGPDVLKLQSIDVLNTVAALGTAWSDNHFKQIKRLCSTVCFIPDIDVPKDNARWGAGIESVIKSGKKAMAAGLQVLVKEVPSDGKKKVDADSYFSSKKMFDEIDSQDFLFWLAEKSIAGVDSTNQKAEIVKDIADLLLLISDKVQRDLQMRTLAKIIKIPLSIFQETLNRISVEKARDKATSEVQTDEDLLKFFGFYARNNSYYGLNKDSEEYRWSNFTLKPLFHIKDVRNAKRLYKAKNAIGQELIIEFKQDELISLSKFKLKLESLGNFLWDATERELNRLKSYLYARTETATEITQLGWQRDDFFAFGNGIVNDGKWVEADDLGIVRIEDKGNYYLPAFSTLYHDEHQLFEFERRFIHIPRPRAMKLREVADQTIMVFGDNVKICFCFLLATLFRDIIIRHTSGKFPILNIYGIRGSGKSHLADVFMKFFHIETKAPNINQATKASLAEHVSRVANALVHIDEYKDSIELDKREFIKGLWDGVGRSRINIDNDKKTEITRVDSGVIITGQEMPTADTAMLSRVLALSFTKTVFTKEEDTAFKQLKANVAPGLTHLTIELLKHRKKFEKEFGQMFKITAGELADLVEGEEVEARILQNWAIALSAFRTLETVIDLGFSYKNLLPFVKGRIIEQNSNAVTQNDLGRFWQLIDVLHQDGRLFIDADYRIQYATEFKGMENSSKIEFTRAKPILYLTLNRPIMLYKKIGRETGEVTLPTPSLRHYLKTSKEFLGTKKSVRFKNVANSMETTVVSQENGRTVAKQTSRVDQAMCFDYEMLRETYGINLEIETVPADEPDPIVIDTDNKELPY